ncbi:hypothetical protein JCM21900_002643 [Sporobolomyces salmonicolor]
MSYSESSLKALTVPKLKEILAAHSLPVTGRKDELVARILASPAASAEETADSTGPSAATDEPDGAGLSGTAELSAAVATEARVGESSAVEEDQGLGTGEAVEGGLVAAGGGAAQPEPSAEDKAAAEQAAKEARAEAAQLEEEKRKARAARFGVTVAPAAEKEGQTDEALKQRAERFGLSTKEEDPAKLDKSLDALDRALGANKRERKPKPTSKAVPVNGVSVADAAASTGGPISLASAAAEPAAAVAADPELAKRMADEEDKKRKRAARFGAAATEPQEKKAKVDEQ